MALISDNYHKKKLKDLNINIKTKYIVGNKILERNTDDSSNDDIKSGIRCEKDYYVNNKLCHTEKIFDSRIEYTFISKEEENMDYKCPNCGMRSKLKNFLEANRINKGINPIELVEEERELIERVRWALSYNDEEYEITYIMDFNKYFKEYLGYKLTEADWQYYEKGYKKFEEIYGKYAAVNRIEEIAEDFKELNRYYKINDRRNGIFVGKMLSGVDPEVKEEEGARQEEEILKSSKEVIVAITGGFHSVALGEILAKEKVNTIVITPSIYAEVEGASKRYKGIIEEQSKQIQYQALAYTVMSSIADTDKRKLILSVIKEISKENKNILEELRQIFGDKVDIEELKKEIEAIKERDIKQEEKTKIKKAINSAVEEVIKVLSKYEYVGEKEIIDVYYYDPLRKNLQPESDLRLNETFRIRKTKKGNYLTYKKQHFKGKLWVYSDEYETKVEDYNTIKKIIKMLGLKELIKVHNRRNIYKYKDFEIELEDIEGLGIFIEVEKMSTLDNEIEIKEEIRDFIRGLKLKNVKELNIGKNQYLISKKLNREINIYNDTNYD